jgi:hypothetical protein
VRPTSALDRETAKVVGKPIWPQGCHLGLNRAGAQTPHCACCAVERLQGAPPLCGELTLTPVNHLIDLVQVYCFKLCRLQER